MVGAAASDGAALGRVSRHGDGVVGRRCYIGEVGYEGAVGVHGEGVAGIGGDHVAVLGPVVESVVGVGSGHHGA